MRQRLVRRRIPHVLFAIAAAVSIECGGGDSTAPAPDTTLAIVKGNNQSATVGAAVAIPPQVKLTFLTGGGPAAGIVVTFAIDSGGGSVTGETQTTDINGVATVGSWVLGTTLGRYTLLATAPGVVDTVRFAASTKSGPPAKIVLNAGDAQTVLAGTPVPVLPSVKVSDAAGNPVTGATVTFLIGSGGGTIVGASQATNSTGIATVTSWTPGAVGANTLTASVTGVTGTVITFNATGTAGPPSRLWLTSNPTTTAVNRAAFATQPLVQIQDAKGNPVAQSGTDVTVAITAGGGTLGGTTTAATDASGAATFTNLSIGGTVGLRTLVFTAPALVSIAGQVTTTAGPASALASAGGDNQTGSPSVALAVAPSVKATDSDGNAVAGVAVTFSVDSGGGSATGPTQTTNSSGVAKVGGWTMGAVAGKNTLKASSSAGSVTFTATTIALTVASVAPAVLVPGASATIVGTGFNTTVSLNTVTIDGVIATVSAATATQLTVTVSTLLPCTATHDGAIVVKANGGTVTTTKPVQVAKQRTLAVGELFVVGPTELRCNELTTTGGRYYVDVYNVNQTYATTGPAFQVRGDVGTGAAGSSADITKAPMATTPSLPSSLRSDAAKRALLQKRAAPDQGEALHLRILEENARFYQEQRARGVTPRSAARRANRTVAPPAVGDLMALRIPKFGIVSNFCQSYVDITARVAYVGTKSIAVEDTTNPVQNIDTTYQQIADEFDNVMLPILQTNFGSPLAMDSLTDNNGREIMVFSHVVNDSMPSLAGFVVSCDLFPRNTTTNTQSNLGEYFYAKVPTAPGTIVNTGAPPRWRWLMRGTIIHESKHIAAFAGRVLHNSPSFEQSWLEESLARTSEEMYERTLYSFAQRSNIPYGSASSPVGSYCGWRACNGEPRGFIRSFEDLAAAAGWFPAPETHSPLGRLDANDFSFYATGWSLVRWAADQSSSAESAFLMALTQEPTKIGVANLEARTGRLFADMLPEWTMANVMDDYPSFTPTLARVAQPTWNFRSQFAGLHTDQASTFPNAWPLVAFTRSFGAFTVESSALAGTASFIELSGTQTAKQLLELKASGTSTAAAPAGIRIAILRVQ